LRAVGKAADELDLSIRRELDRLRRVRLIVGNADRVASRVSRRDVESFLDARERAVGAGADGINGCASRFDG
jgi:hypothetical protein